ncbi:hypothetical protein ACFC0W_35975 [Actinacidiphila glaucinigra]
MGWLGLAALIAVRRRPQVLRTRLAGRFI